jgi:hypothetical protein
MFHPLMAAVPGYFPPIQCAVTTPIRKEVITSFLMGVKAHCMGQQIPEVLPRDGKNVFCKNKSTWQYQ